MQSYYKNVFFFFFAIFFFQVLEDFTENQSWGLNLKCHVSSTCLLEEDSCQAKSFFQRHLRYWSQIWEGIGCLTLTQGVDKQGFESLITSRKVHFMMLSIHVSEVINLSSKLFYTFNMWSSSVSFLKRHMYHMFLLKDYIFLLLFLYQKKVMVVISPESQQQTKISGPVFFLCL